MWPRSGITKKNIVIITASLHNVKIDLIGTKLEKQWDLKKVTKEKLIIKNHFPKVGVIRKAT